MEMGKMMGHKRSYCAVNQEADFMPPTSKRNKAGVSISAKERKEKLNGKIIALQQLVSPYGKTDTGSVLLGAMGYIQFLHEQLKLLSAPYLHGSPMAKRLGIELEPYRYSPRIRGLCIVPLCFAEGVARSNGADIWTPIYTKSPKIHDPISSFH